MARFFLAATAVNGFLSVALGAFAAHGLKQALDAYHLGVFQTGVQYHFYHTLALGLVAALGLKEESALLRAAGYGFLSGIVVFSGSLYLLALTQVSLWGAVTPVGGVAFLVGWALLLVAALR